MTASARTFWVGPFRKKSHVPMCSNSSQWRSRTGCLFFRVASSRRDWMDANSSFLNAVKYCAFLSTLLAFSLKCEPSQKLLDTLTLFSCLEVKRDRFVVGNVFLEKWWTRNFFFHFSIVMNLSLVTAAHKIICCLLTVFVQLSFSRTQNTKILNLWFG